MGIIGIYPEWNVKVSKNDSNLLGTFIGIYPEWNVKKNCSKGTKTGV